MLRAYSVMKLRATLACALVAVALPPVADAAGLSRASRDQGQVTTAGAAVAQPQACPTGATDAVINANGRARIIAPGDTVPALLSGLPRPALGPVVVSPTTTAPLQPRPAQPAQPAANIDVAPAPVLAPGQRLVIGAPGATTTATEVAAGHTAGGVTTVGTVEPAPDLSARVAARAVFAASEQTAPAQAPVAAPQPGAPRTRIERSGQPAAAPVQAPVQPAAPTGVQSVPPTVTDLLKPAPMQPTYAQQGQATGAGAAQRFTPSSAASVAAANSIDLQITAANIADAEAQVRQTFGLDDFRVTASAMIGRRGPIATATFPAGEGGENTTIALGDPDIRTGSIDLVKPLYTSGRIERTQQVALKALETRKLSKAVIERALDLSARQVVYEILRLEQLAGVAQERANAVAAHVDLSKKLMAGGVVPKFEVVQAETELARARGEVISARTGVEQAKASLRRVLTLPQETPVGVAMGDPPQTPPGAITDLIQQAWENRPEIRTSEASVALAEASLRLAFASRNVSVNLVGGLTATQASFGSEPFGWQIAISAEKPILDAKQEKTQVEQAKAQLDAARLELERQKQEVALEVTQSHLALDDGQQRLAVAQQGVIEAQERLRISQVRYENGLALGVEVLDAQTALTAAQAEVVNAQYALYSAIARLRSSVGLWSGNE